jgi:hypothetical protein
MKTRNVFGCVLIALLLLLATGSGLAREPQPTGDSDAAGVNTSPGATAPWYVETVDSASGVGLYTSVAIDQYGTTFISYYDWANKDLKMATHVGSGGNCGTDNTWYCETVDSSGSDTGRYSSIAIDPTTNLPVIAYGYSPSRLKLATAWSGGWDIRTVTEYWRSYASLKIDSTGAAHIAYYGWESECSNNCLLYAKRVSTGAGNCGEGNFQCDVIDSNDLVGQHASLAIDSSGQPRIAYYDGGNGGLWYAQPDTPGNCGPGNTWGCYQVSSGSGVGQYASLGIDNRNISHIAYYDATAGKLMYAVQIGKEGNCGPLSSWQCDEIANMGTGTFPRNRDVALAVDKADSPIIAYSWYYGTKFATRGFSWARPTAALGQGSGNCGPGDLWQCSGITDGTYSGDYSAIAVNPSGLATIAYSHGEFFSSLRVAYQQYHQIFLPLVEKQ